MKLKISLIAIVLGLLIGSSIITRSNQPPEPQEQPSSQALVQAASEDNRTFSYQGKNGMTALALLKQKAEVTIENSSFGEFVKGINEFVADGTTEYWAFYVNGAYANEGAGAYVTSDIDTIEWKLEAIQ